VRQTQAPYQPLKDETAAGEDLATVNARLDNLTRQLERMAQENAAQENAAQENAAPADEHTGAGKAQKPDELVEALARLDRRLDQVIDEGRAAARNAEQKPPQPAPSVPPAATARHDTAGWAAQISARQRALDSAPIDATRWQPDFASLERQLRQIDTRISSLHLPYDKALTALRSDLAEIGRALTEALPRQAIEALEAEVRVLAEHLERSQQAGAGGAGLQALRHELAEVRQFLNGLTPAESLAGFQDAVHGLSQKIDRLASAADDRRDPATVEQVGQAVASLRGVVSNTASDGMLAQLVGEVHRLGAQLERATASTSAETLARLETRIASLTESGHMVPPGLEESIRALSERLDRMQLSRGDQLALGSLEDRIAGLSEKLDASSARLNHLEAIERGLADLLVHLEEIRNESARGLRAAPTPAGAAGPVPSPLDLIADAMPSGASIETPAPPQPAAQRPSPAETMTRGAQRRPIDPTLPPDTPLEPGTGRSRAKPGSAAARIAASEAALGNARPAPAETGGRLAAIAAARNAARAAYRDAPAKKRPSFILPLGQKAGGWLQALRAKAAAISLRPQPRTAAGQDTVEPVIDETIAETPAAPESAPASAPILGQLDDMPIDRPLSRRQRVLSAIKTLLIVASVVIIVVGAAQTVMELLFSEHKAATPAAVAPKPGSAIPHTTTPKSQAPAIMPQAPAQAPQAPATAPQAPATTPAPAGLDSGASFFDPLPLNPPEPVEPPAAPAPASRSTPAPSNDVTGSIAPYAGSPRSTAHGGTAALDALPASIGPVLRMAAAANEPAAEYELGTRYAEGRGVPRDLSEATQWLQRAADAGFAPAQFRLGSLKEKGDGVKKDPEAARRLYLAAARKGHAKAMHNLAVLYAEGINDKPDYTVAAEWFRRAANYGVTDSQYNLAILYARGIGVQADLAEAYRWFALAASKGDADAARKRDQVGAELDQYTLAAAKREVQTFVAKRQPEEATSLRVPPGGWDRAPAPPAKPRR
jgi:localization factor PodJL